MQHIDFKFNHPRNGNSAFNKINYSKYYFSQTPGNKRRQYILTDEYEDDSDLNPCHTWSKMLNSQVTQHQIIYTEQPSISESGQRRKYQCHLSLASDL